MRLSRFAVALLLPFALLALTGPISGQKLARKYFEDTKHGFRVKPLDDQTAVPAQPREEKLGLLTKMAGKDVYVYVDDTNVLVRTELYILRFEEERDLEEGRDDGKSVAEEVTRGDIVKYLETFYKVDDIDKPVVDREKKVKKLVAHHRRWEGKTPSYNIPMFLDLWSFELEDADIHLLYSAPQKSPKFLKVFEKSAKTFEPIEREETLTLGKDATYEEMLAYHEEDAARIKGWRALATPSKKYIIKTSSDNRKFLDEVIERLEKSRELYEQDFPPPPDFKHVSIVRVCGSEDEFHQYGNTGGGVAGWFNPSSTELVLYDAVNVNRNMTYAVMSHEAFHQYCHFLFGQSEAHRWFDEGHGDYYGGVDFDKGKIGTRMPAGLNRLSVIKEMVREGSFASVESHVNFDHGEWQSQGPSNVSCYAQSWSIIYMLRQGALGKVPKKVWKDGYADIIPNYVKTLNAGYREAYDELKKKLDKKKKKKKDGEDGEDGDPRLHVTSKKKEEIWKKAMEASWGQIDIYQFEEDWLAFVKDHL